MHLVFWVQVSSEKGGLAGWLGGKNPARMCTIQVFPISLAVLTLAEQSGTFLFSPFLNEFKSRVFFEHYLVLF